MEWDQFKKHNYKIIEAKDEWEDTVIEKDSITATFSIRDLDNNIERIQKVIREIESKFNHEKLTVSNIEEHHPWIKDMSEQDIYTAWMYQEAKVVVAQYEPRLKEFKDALATDMSQREYVKTILKEFKDALATDMSQREYVKTILKDDLKIPHAGE